MSARAYESLGGWLVIVTGTLPLTKKLHSVLLVTDFVAVRRPKGAQGPKPQGTQRRTPPHTFEQFEQVSQGICKVLFTFLIYNQ